MKEQIKALRVSIDGIAQLTKELRPVERYDFDYSVFNSSIIPKLLKFNSKEIEKAVDSLYLSKAWLGKVLGELGNENPYGSGYKTKEDIVPTQDVSYFDNQVPPKVVNEEIVDRNHIEKVDWLRTEIKKLIDNSTDFSLTYPEIELEQGFVYKYLSEARFFLGFELSRIKNEN